MLFCIIPQKNENAMRNVFCYSVSLILIFASCKEQTKKNDPGETMVETVVKKEKGNPKIDIVVNKRYDKKGDLVAFDSVYSYYYSNRVGEKALMDSLFQTFKPVISQEFPLMKDKRFVHLFLNDSLFYTDFFHEDYFRKRLELNERYMKNLMMQMDSIKNAYFKVLSKHPSKK